MVGMKHLFGPAGQADLADTVARRPLLAFDFDGTLAPIVARPADARMPVATLRRLRLVSRHLPVAVISGRALDDLRRLVGIDSVHLVGNHGAEDPHVPQPPQLRSALDGARARLHLAADELMRAGVTVEDKGASMALHYRSARDRLAAQAAIDRALQPLEPGVQVFGGKLVINVVAAAADDKAASLRRVAARAGVQAVVYLGDDVNDESVFAAKDPHWLTVRVGADAARSEARYFVESPRELPRLLDRILSLIEAAPG
jgi:trehalose 6-phosphate phosphatase